MIGGTRRQPNLSEILSPSVQQSNQDDGDGGSDGDSGAGGDGATVQHSREEVNVMSANMRDFQHFRKQNIVYVWVKMAIWAHKSP